MKPIKLKISGLNSFIQTQTIDFENLGKDNLFCISGSTGSGKTTIVDAIILALYGSTKRGNLVDAINLSCQKAVVELTLELEGSVYTIVREIRRKSGNLATVYKENGEIEASGIKDVDAFVLSKVGLEKDQFTKVVMLQQGEFDKFLSDNRNDRMKVIEKLTDIGNYKKAIELINFDEREAKSDVENCKTTLETYADVSDEILSEKNLEINQKLEAEKVLLAQKAEQAKAVETIKKKLADYKIFKEREDKINASKLELLQIEKEFEKLNKDKENSITYTENLDKTVAQISQNGKKREEMSAFLAQATQADGITAKINKALSEYKQTETDKSEKEKLMMAHTSKAQQIKDKYGYSEERAKEIEESANSAYADMRAEFARQKFLATNLATTQKEIADKEEKIKNKSLLVAITEKTKNENSLLVDKKRDELKRVEDEVEKLRSNNALGVVLANLKVGDICPVCGEKVKSLSHAKDMGDISSATANLKRAKTENEQAQELLKKSENAHITAINEYETLKNDLDKLKAKAEEIKSGFGDIISEEKIRESEDKAKSAKEFLACVMQINTLTEVILDKEKDLAKRKAEGEELRKQQTELRDNLVKNCGTFVLSEISKKIDELRQKDKELEVQRKQIEELLKNLSDREILLKEKKKNKLEFYESLKNEHTYCEKVDQNAVVRVEQELAQTENAIIKTVSDRSSLQTQVKDIEKRLEQKKNKEKELKEKQKRHDNLKELKELVKGSAFTDFVADAFIEEITIDASERMSKLSCGQYSLYYDDGVFFVKDYLSAGESRNVTTLSGGEKFLASLSLAIAISRRTAQSRDYGFFFIDEGFGTLDENALETVCASLEALAQDTVVGVITHRSELIERIPSVLHVEKADGISGSKCSERF